MRVDCMLHVIVVHLNNLQNDMAMLIKWHIQLAYDARFVWINEIEYLNIFLLCVTHV